MRAGAKRRWNNPMARLVVEMRAAAARIDCAPARAIAAREADAIPQTFAEKMPKTIKGGLAREARRMMRELPFIRESERGAAARFLVFLADLLESPGAGTVVSEERLDRPRLCERERRRA